MILESAIAMRGKGGLFAEYRVTETGANFDAHILAALLVAYSLALHLLAPLWFPAFVAGFFLFTKPSPHWNFRTIDHREAFMRVLWIVPSTLRMALILPLLLVIGYIITGELLTSPLLLLPPLLLAFCYFLGGVAYRLSATRDAVEFSEWVAGATAGGVMYGMANAYRLPALPLFYFYQ